MDNIEARNKLIEAIKRFENVMVATRLPDGTMHARPMALADVDDEGVLWFVTSIDSPKVAEAETDARGLVTAQSSSLYLSVSGRITFVRDPGRIEALWRPTWKVWFPRGKKDPSISLMRVTPEIGEYWDHAGAKGVRFLFDAARALVAGERPSTEDEERHAKVSL